MGCRCNGELTKFGNRNDRADWTAGLESHLVTQVGQLAATTQNSYCEIWIVNSEKIAGFGFLFAAPGLIEVGLNIFLEAQIIQALRWDRGRPRPQMSAQRERNDLAESDVDKIFAPAARCGRDARGPSKSLES